MSQPSTIEKAFTPPLLLKLALAAALSVAVVSLVPRTVHESGNTPPVRMLIVTAVLVAAICTVALVLGLRFDLGLPWNAVLYTVGFNVFIIVVKLALAPHGFYDVNQVKTIDSTFAIDNELMATMAAALIFVLYVAAFLVLYRFFRRRIAHLDEVDPVERLGKAHNIVLVAIALSVLVAASGSALFLVLLPLAAGFGYLDFVFSSSLSVLVGLALAGATALAALAFDSTSRRASVVGDASLFTSFFWVGLYFLALYHVLWVVYVLVLTSIWPLRVVTPK